MNATVASAIAEGLAELSRVVATPAEPLGFGGDVSCTSDLREAMPDISEPRQVLGEYIARTLDTPRGSIPDAPDRGVDLRGALHRPLTRPELLAYETAAANELRKDDRIASAQVTLTASADGRAVDIAVVVTARDPLIDGPFALTLALTDAGVLIRELSR